MTSAVVDVSVLVSAAITPRGTPPHQVVQAWASGQFELIASPRLLAELRRTLTRPKLARYIYHDRAEQFARELETNARIVDDPIEVVPATRDPDDDYLVALAKASDANLIVSSDRDLLEADLADVAVVHPRDFVGQLNS